MIIPIADTETVRGVLRTLGIPFVADPGNGTGPWLRVQMSDELDALLEEVVHALADLRWRYEPGRSLQMELFDMEAVDGAH